MEELIFKQLLSLAGGKLVLKPAQLVKVTGWNVQTQSRLRRFNKMPIPWKTTGKAITYSIADVAKYLLNPTPIHYEEKTEDFKPDLNIKVKRRLKTYDFSSQMILNAFTSYIEEQKNLINDLSEGVKALTLRINLQEEIKDKNTAWHEGRSKI